jgi:hypothetical protein
MELCIKIQLSFEQHLILPNHKPQRSKFPLFLKYHQNNFAHVETTFITHKATIGEYNAILSVSFLKLKMEEVLIKPIEMMTNEYFSTFLLFLTLVVVL